MCRNIKKLRFAERGPTDEEIKLAARQFVRKVSGYREPSRVNTAVFEETVEEVAEATKKMFDGLVVR